MRAGVDRGQLGLAATQAGLALEFRLRFDHLEHVIGPITQSACELSAIAMVAAEALRQSRPLPLFLRRHQEPPPAMVQHEEARQSGEGSRASHARRAARSA